MKVESSLFLFLRPPSSTSSRMEGMRLAHVGLVSVAMTPSTIEWSVHRRSSLTFRSPIISKFNLKKKIDTIRLTDATDSDSNTKRANLSVARKERIKLPSYGDSFGAPTYHISQFLRHPSGIESILNKNALKSFQFVDDDTYRCTLPKIQLLNFEASPTLDLRVNPTDDDCTVEMLSCKFEGSEVVERQNSHFSALMTNHMKWNTSGSVSILEADVKLDLSLEIYTLPFTMMPKEAVEGPGNFMLQALLDSLVPLLLKQLVQDYEKWVKEQMDYKSLDLVPDVPAQSN